MSARRGSPRRGPGLVLRLTAGRPPGDGAAGWGGRMIGVLERIIDPAPMARGRALARSGQVLTLQVTSGTVRAAVQGSQPAPFTVEFTVRGIDGYDRDELAAQVRAEPGMLTALAGGAVPWAMAERLLPADASDLDFECTCPDPGWPCKHGVAVALLTAQEFDARPTGLLTWRGVDVDGLIAAVADPGGDAGGDAGAAAPDGTGPFRLRGPLPPLPSPVPGRTALDLLDTARLRSVLRLWGADTADAERELEALYRRMTARG